MLARIVEFALAQRLLVCLLTVLLCAGGAYALQQLPIDAFPDVSPVQVKVIMKAPGMTPEEVEARITAPIELEMIGIPYKKFLRSVTKYALTDVTIEFEDNVDIYWARNQVTERLTAITKDLPAGVTGGLAPITTPLGEMFMFTVEGGTLTLEQRRTLLDWTIRPALRTLPGVADVNSLGGVVRSFEVIPDNAALVAHGVTIDALRKAVEANNRNDGAGRLRDGEEVLLVRSEGNIRNLDDLKAIVVASRDGKIVRVGDVARVEFGTVTRYGVVTKDGQGEAVQGLVLGLRGANARMVVEGVKKKLAELQPSLPAGVTIKPFYDRGELVQRSVSTISTALLEATALVVVLLVLFLGDWRAALVVVATLPLAALSTFILMRVFGMSANLMSLGGLAIAIGMLIDAAVVVVENVVSEVNRSHASRHVPLLNIIFRGTREVAVPVTSGITIIVIVFLPLLTLQGLEGKLFIPVALSIVFALSSSLILSLTVIPVLSSFLLKRESHADTWLTRRAIATYVPALRWSLRHEKLVFTLALGVLAGAGVVYTLSGKTFMPTMDEGSIIVGIEKIPSVSIEETAAVDLKIHKAIMAAIPEVTGIVARAGADELGLDPMGLNQTDTYLLTKPPSEWRKPNDKEWLEGELRKVLDKLPGISYSFTQPIDMRVQEMIIGVRGDVVVKIFGPDIPTLNKLAVEITQKLETVPGNEDVRTVLNDGVQYLSVAVDRLQAGALGLNVDDIADGLRAQIEGVPLGIVLEEGRRTPVLLRGSETVRGSSATFTDLRVTLPDGSNVPLSSLARLDRIDGPVKIDRENGRRLALVQSDVKGRDLVGFVDEAKKIVSEQVKLPRGYELAWGGQFENQQRAAARLEIVVPIALALIFLLLFTTFGSIRQASLVFVNIPFALVGGIFTLSAAGEYLSVPASVGFIALLGIAVLNGLVLVTYFNQLVAEGEKIEDVVLNGALRRLRPVLLTASITAFGLVPLLFATGPGSEVQRPLAIVVIGGLVSSTLLTLLILPLLYRRFGVSSKARLA
ncbi:CusA/CzcA family heavy metal efflux RND transporter [Reyranella sp.]|jgi:cobalt-zinc-cadmium resistance protein CzcA|uniref:efflux RND transporter permease subunit n=1 Tax=Reyranella sp. TaxID=1929291 RepID=UPI000BCC277F|nr:CusA/CzcA family heavy metal efflux RND transporter [Reyranella sp.]OYY33877.1 MAG: CusA/CzcA family heavy metal efflux RND transporter [Rhodospirillales bacterium 35-66-84]OYZ90883.1 MAG: CusA/CzcA family heavy metal efflux RND transporter [Rhodospirillales bacterium 24-66-33]OZB21174.1 MAG: CusA/CzcA family heavy metal efflux RND transporter [Rhodospirillales bacterium 39-66-50]HQS19274.1 CusA/CzcA family heavy metal efflux RND transporter [Reyranella sp.]HQT15523.1 CusA/CzcA family heavy